MNIFHTPIFVNEILETFALSPNSVVADLTTGEGGHSSFLAPSIPSGRLLCVDRDPEILACAKKRLSQYSNINFVCDTYDHLDLIRKEHDYPLFDAVLVDMGISMYHFKEANRGFSFKDKNFDMRLNPNQILSARHIINTFDVRTLSDIFYYYGEERRARKIASDIVKNRPFQSAEEFSRFVAIKIPRKGRIHAATKIFQSLRIYLNKELEITEKLLMIILDHLRGNAIFGVITFHSLEDRLIKKAFLQYQVERKGTMLTKKPILPTQQEIHNNPASRSAKLRFFKRGI